MSQTIKINRATVLILWAAVIAERLGFAWEEALTLGRAGAGLTAYSKGKRLGLFEPTPEAVQEKRRQARKEAGAFSIDLLGRAVPVIHTEEGLRALSKETVIKPAAVEKYLASKFGDDLEEVTNSMRKLAGSLNPGDLARRGFNLYVQFRPDVPEGTSGWGAKGELDLGSIAALAKKKGKE